MQDKVTRRKAEKEQRAQDEQAERLAENMRSSTREKNVSRDRKSAAAALKEATQKKKKQAAQAEKCVSGSLKDCGV